MTEGHLLVTSVRMPLSGEMMRFYAAAFLGPGVAVALAENHPDRGSGELIES